MHKGALGLTLDGGLGTIERGEERLDDGEVLTEAFDRDDPLASWWEEFFC